MWTGRDASDRIIRYYSYLFTFPSHRTMIAAIAALSTTGCALTFALAWGAASILRGALYGLLGLAAPLLASDALAVLLFKDDPLLTPRRFTILSYASCIVYVAVALLSSLAVALTGGADLLARGALFAIAVNTFLRHLIVPVFSTRGPWRNLAAAFMPPVFCLATVALLPFSNLRLLALGAVGVAIAAAGVRLLLWVLMRWRGPHERLRLIPLFRAFILAWAEELNGPLEDQITRVGEVRDLYVDSLVYRDAAGGCRAALIVPYIHPGPFRNVGSSALPQVIADRVSGKLGCEVLVSHGISTHERDLTRSGEVERVAEAITAGLLPDGVDVASPVVRAERNGAQASCQMFGGVALVTLTLSPKSYDDLPEELGERIMAASAEMGVTAVVVDAHNSIQRGDELTDDDVNALIHAAVEAIKGARAAPRYRFSVGVARVIPREWGLDEGMGPCGVAALAVRLEDGRTHAYVVADGNNMRSGLRERILAALESRVDSAEVLTSDTHLVNAIGATDRGYYPVGERIDPEMFTGYVVEAVEAAVSNLEGCRCSHVRISVPGLTVLGKRGLNLLGDVLESAFGLFKRTALVVTTSSLLLAAAAVFLL